jgi:hypothetical protein
VAPGACPAALGTRFIYGAFPGRWSPVAGMRAVPARRVVERARRRRARKREQRRRQRGWLAHPARLPVQRPVRRRPRPVPLRRPGGSVAGLVTEPQVTGAVVTVIKMKQLPTDHRPAAPGTRLPVSLLDTRRPGRLVRGTITPAPRAAPRRPAPALDETCAARLASLHRHRPASKINPRPLSRSGKKCWG